MGSSESTSNRSSRSSKLNKSLIKISDRIFDTASFDNFSIKFGEARRNGSLKNLRKPTVNTISEHQENFKVMSLNELEAQDFS